MSGHGMNVERLAHLKAVVEDDIKKDLYFGGRIIVARHGEIAFDEAFGTADSKKTRPVKKDSVFSLFSVSKSFTNVLVLRAIEMGQFAFHTKIKDVVPQFAGKGRDDINVLHLLTHSSGMPPVYTASEGMYIDVLEEVVMAICENVAAIHKPNEEVAYSALVSHAMLGYMLVKTDPKGRRYRDIANQDLLLPLGLKDTSVGRRRDLAERHLVPEFRGNSPTQHLGHSNLGPNGAFEEENAEMPWVGIVSTALDMYRFGEMFRNMGSGNGVRILSPRMVELARRNWTGDKPNVVFEKLCKDRGWPVIPAYIGLGFPLRGDAVGVNLYGSLTTPQTMGGYGAGTTIWWVDPVHDLTFVGLMTGVMNSDANYVRWRRLSDIAVSACV
ncbi:MAG: serine hydrolase domain-containing protein [Alphaproteobacteria bacterium]